MGCVRGGGQGRECLSVEVRTMGVAVGLSISRRTWIFLDASMVVKKSHIHGPFASHGMLQRLQRRILSLRFSMLIYLMAKARKSWKRIGQTVRDLVSVSER